MSGGSFFARDRSWQPPALTPQYRTSVARSPNRALLSMPQTLSETTGPVFAPNTVRPVDADLIHNYAAAGESAVGPRIIVYGRVVDETGRGVPNALLEVWQANAGGRYRHKKEGYIAALDPNFSGCGRCMTDAEGNYEFRTIQPGAYPWPNRANDWRPAHIHFSIFGEAFAQRLITQMYFEGDPMIRLCPIVQGIPHDEGIDSLTAALDMTRTIPMDARAYKFDMVLRGRRQTMFENRMEGGVMAQKLSYLKESPSQTAGPYVHIGCLPNMCEVEGVYDADLGVAMLADATKGQRITITGAIYDGTGTALKDAMVEIWQADAEGIYPGGRDPRGPGDPNFSGWGRKAGDYTSGEWTFETIKPGTVPFPDGRSQAPHITFWVVARGINVGLQTRMYFPDEDNSADPILTRIEHQNRVPTLIAEKTGEDQYRFDIRLQGEGETIFFDI